MNHNIFAIELCLRLEPEDRLRAPAPRPRGLAPVRLHARATSGSCCSRVSELLLENQHLFEKGCWDFFDDDARALKRLRDVVRTA